MSDAPQHLQRVTSFEVCPDRTWGGGKAPSWVAELVERTPVIVRPGEDAPILAGDPRDGLPIGVTLCRWGIPNPWAVAKGAAPDEVTMQTITVRQLRSPSGRLIGDRRCLVPATAIGGLACPRWTTLAAVRWGLDRLDHEGTWVGGFAFVTEGAQWLVVREADHEDWLDGWRRFDDAVRCCVPLCAG